MRQFTFDLTAASLSSDSNPFISASSMAPGSGPTSTPASGDSGSSTVTSAMTTDNNYHKAHGIIMGVTVVLLFPIGALFMRVVGHPWMHGLLQIFSLIGLIAGFALGVKMAKMDNMVSRYLRSSNYYIHSSYILLFWVMVGKFQVPR
jgi:hypothetical protein